MQRDPRVRRRKRCRAASPLHHSRSSTAPSPGCTGHQSRSSGWVRRWWISRISPRLDATHRQPTVEAPVRCSRSPSRNYGKRDTSTSESTASTSIGGRGPERAVLPAALAMLDEPANGPLAAHSRSTVAAPYCHPDHSRDTLALSSDERPTGAGVTARRWWR